MTDILYISNIRIPTEKAHGLQVFKTCSALSELGVKLTLVAPRRVNPLRDDPFKYFDVKRNFELKKVFCIDLMFLPFAKRFSFILETLSFSIRIFFLILFSDNKSVIYTRDLSIAFLSSLFSGRVFFEIHNISKRFQWFTRFVLSRVRGIIVISDGLKKELIKNKISETKIMVARDGVDLEKFDTDLSRQEARKILGLPLDKKIVLYTGHLYEWKGADIFAKASQYLRELDFYIVGGTKEDVNRFKGDYKNENLHIVGHRPALEIPLWLKAAQILVLPNSAKQKISREYTSPLKLFEYMASGTPIIASDLSSLREVVGDGEVIFFEADNVLSLVDKIKYCMVSYDKILRNAMNAKKAAGNYTWDSRAKIILHFINSKI